MVVGAVMAFDLADAGQCRPRDVAAGVLHLGDPCGVAVGLQRGHRHLQGGARAAAHA